MFLNSVVLILREVVEAGVILSVLLAISHRFAIGKRWCLIALGGGLGFATFYSFWLGEISASFDGSGQERLGIAMHVAIIALLVYLQSSLCAFIHGRTRGRGATHIVVAMTVIGTLSLSRECGEILLYLHGFIQVPDYAQAVLSGAALGAAIGLSAAFFVYLLLSQIHLSRPVPWVAGIVVVIGAGQSVQASKLMHQMDWLPAQNALYDSSFMLSENSLAGQLLHAIIGYEASPSPAQFALYWLSAALLLAPWVYQRMIRNAT